MSYLDLNHLLVITSGFKAKLGVNQGRKVTDL